MNELAVWSQALVDEECHEAHAVYDADLTRRYAEYFAKHPELRGEHFFSARDITAALPPGWGRLASLLPVEARHRHHLSGKSSQTLTLGLLGVAAHREPDMAWLAEAFPAVGGRPITNASISFEFTLPPRTLGEQPRQTSLDVLIESDDFVIVAEAKWREAGLGTCSCERAGGDPRVGRCNPRVLERAAYWQAATESLQLPPRTEGMLCPISLSYQAVRNVAAVRALRGNRRAVFALLYDENNPYFRKTGRWPGWPAMLGRAMADSDVAFAAVSWQDIVQRLPLDAATLRWARVKHGLG